MARRPFACLHCDARGFFTTLGAVEHVIAAHGILRGNCVEGEDYLAEDKLEAERAREIAVLERYVERFVLVLGGEERVYSGDDFLTDVAYDAERPDEWADWQAA